MWLDVVWMWEHSGNLREGRGLYQSFVFSLIQYSILLVPHGRWKHIKNVETCAHASPHSLKWRIIFKVNEESRISKEAPPAELRGVTTIVELGEENFVSNLISYLTDRALVILEALISTITIQYILFWVLLRHSDDSCSTAWSISIGANALNIFTWISCGCFYMVPY